MAFVHTLARTWQASGRSIESPKTYSGDAQESLDVDVADSETDFEIAFQLDVSQIQSIYIVSDQDVTLETNNGSSPAETINLLAGVPYVWATGDYLANLLATDITALFVTNASGSAARFQLEVVSDPTV